jgi:hypothetical protein
MSKVTEILQDEKKIGTLGRDGQLTYVADMTDGRRFVFDPRINGKIEPFSMIVYDTDNDTTKLESGNVALRIYNNVFEYNHQFYALRILPEGSIPGEHLLGSRFIARFVNFPFKSPDELDPETRERLGRFRGIRAGEISGSGITGYKITLEDELMSIGIPLSVALFLLNSTGEIMRSNSVLHS